MNASKRIQTGRAKLTTPLQDAIRTVTTPEGIVLVATTEPVCMFHPDGVLQTVRVTKWRSAPITADLVDGSIDIARRNRSVGTPAWSPVFEPLPGKEALGYDADSLEYVAAQRRMEDQYAMMRP